ncbi:MAG: PqqD family protein [Myxococcota bacterium]|nr:PqqD family protein [Myxococcota bacterium]
MNSTKLITPHRRVAARIVDGCALILDPRTDQLQRLNEVGSFIWARIIERSHTSASIRDLLIDEFQVDEATAQSDLSAFLDKLAARDLIEYASD